MTELDLNKAMRLFACGSECDELHYGDDLMWRSPLGLLIDDSLAIHRPWDGDTLEGYNPTTGDFTKSVSNWSDADIVPGGGAVIENAAFSLGNVAGRRISFNETIDMKGKTLLAGVRIGSLDNTVYFTSSGGSDSVRFMDSAAGVRVYYRFGAGDSGNNFILGEIDLDEWAVVAVSFSDDDVNFWWNGDLVYSDTYVASHWNVRHFGWHNTSQHPVDYIAGPIVVDGSSQYIVDTAQEYLQSVISTLQ